MNEYIAYQFTDSNVIINQLELFLSIMLVIMIVEVFIDFCAKKKRDYKETLANFGVSVGNQIIGSTAGKIVAGIGVLFFSNISLFKLEVNWWTWILALLIVDLSYYWLHRTEHRVRLFWMNHNVHHSSTDFNLSTSVRQGWFDDFTLWTLLIPAVYFGFNPLQCILAGQIVALYQIWVHNQKVGKLGFLDGILNTPSLHRVHHGSNQKYIDKNYGGILIIWDRLFGTYEPETEKVVYGLTENVNTHNPLKINFIEHLRTLSIFRKSQGFMEKSQSIFGPPEWKPKVLMDKRD
ncbi:sterol desaturase family protein [Nostoc sp. MG11]|uniref:sterol desaturase family protein n=1 Tax=Nostoc sp. MG11 TaxID=2721166 RepID=UPI001867991D|nr:sterol desaturase family protein [Nostoc sp. MG11]